MSSKKCSSVDTVIRLKYIDRILFVGLILI